MPDSAKEALFTFFCAFPPLTTADMSQQGAGPASKMTITDQDHKTWCQEAAWTKN